MIGLLIQSSPEHNMMGINMHYVNLAETIAKKCGVRVRYISPQEKFIEDLTLLIIPGGADVYQGEKGTDTPISMLTRRSNPQLDWWDRCILPEYLESNTPILAICRGMQAIGYYLGFNLIEHVPHKITPAIVELAKEKIVFKSFKHKGSYKVNSRHHQVLEFSEKIKLDEIRGKVKITAHSKKYKTIEAFEAKNLLAVQWHPEYLLDKYTMSTIYKILNVRV